MKTLALALATTALTATVASAAGIGVVDQNGDRFASKAEIAAVYPTMNASDFRELDINRDNRISAPEFTAPGASAILNKHVAGNTIMDVSGIDANGDGFASASELSAAYPGLTTVDFRDIDTNNDNRVSRVELYASDAQSILNRYDGGASILVSLSSVDTDGSGFASYGELAARYPGLSSTDFQDVDLNGDNRVSFTELYNLDAIKIFGENL